MPRVTKDTLKIRIKQINPNCNPKYLSQMNVAELKLAAAGNLDQAVTAYEARIVANKARTQAIVVESGIKKTKKNKIAVSKELKEGVIAIGGGNKAKGQRMLMNAKAIAKRNKATADNKVNKKIRKYNKIISTIDGMIPPDDKSADKEEKRRKKQEFYANLHTLHFKGNPTKYDKKFIDFLENKNVLQVYEKDKMTDESLDDFIERYLVGKVFKYAGRV